MSSRLPELTPTSYAILGLLAIRAWPTYELAKQMQRDLRFVWPRAESNLYAEPKKLVAHGFASASSDPRGRRRRTGRLDHPGRHGGPGGMDELPAAESRWESESIVKLLFANSGSPERLLDHLCRFREQAGARWKAVEAIFRPYLAGDEPFPDRTHVNVLGATLVLETARAEAEWADRAIEEVRTWRTTTFPEHRAAAYDALRAALDAGEP